MKNAIIGIVVVILIAIGGGAYYVLSNLDGLIRNAIEYYGSRATSTDVRVSGVSVSLAEGRASIRGLTVANPEGFAAPHAFTLTSATVQIDTASLTSEPYVIDLIDVAGPRMFFEVNQEGADNLRTLRDNLDAAPAPASEEPSQPSPRLAIGRITLAEAAMSANIVPLNESREVVMPAITMTNLAGQPPEIARQILDQLIDSALATAREEGMNRLKEGALEKLGEKLGVDGEAVDKLKDKLGF